MKSKNFVIKVELYDYDVMISCGETVTEIKKNLRKICVYHPNEEYITIGTSSGRAIEFDDGQFLILLQGIPKTNRQFSILQHEIFHIVVGILKRIGVKLSEDSEEVYAYLIDHITEKIYDKL